MSTKNKRQLAAVMFTDIVGYTAMMQEDEQKANIQREQYRKILEEKASEFEGRTLHYYGDGALTIFSSAYNAVICAIRIQSDLKNAHIPLRIGIHMGDLVFSEDEVFGDAVNLASRLEDLSIAGGILISEKVKEEISNHRDIRTKSLGAYQLKNVQQPLEIHTVSNEGLNVASKKEIKARSGKLNNRVAVLPFVNMSEELGFDYFSDGLTEEIINGLTKMQELDVTSRTSAFAYKGRNEDIRSIGEKLSVSHVLEGSVRKSKDKIRVTAQLIETGEGFHLWSETYERHLKDIFEIQDTLCQQIVEKFESSLSTDRKIETSQKTNFESSEAYELYLEGKFQWKKFTAPSAQKALKNFGDAINVNPDFANAYVQLAICHLYLGTIGQMSARLAFTKARKHVDKAQQLDDTNAEAYAVSGLIEVLLDQNFEEANELFSEAFKRNEHSAFTHYGYFIFLNILGRDNEAIQYMERALALDPSNLMYHSELGRAYYCARRYPEALEQFNYTLEHDSSFLAALNGKGWTYVAMGNNQKAHGVFEIYQNLVSQDQKNIPQLVYMAGKLDMTETARHFLDLLQLGNAQDNYSVTPVDIALIYLGLEQYDEVLFHLKRAIDDKIGSVLFIDSDPVWDDIKQLDGYKDMISQLNLPKSTTDLELIDR